MQDLDVGALYIGNDMLAHVGKLQQLKNLNLFGNPIDSIALKQIENLQNLETLYLYRTFIDDMGVGSIAKLKNLKRLNMFDTFLTDKGLGLLAGCKQLKHLSIGNSKIKKPPITSVNGGLSFKFQLRNRLQIRNVLSVFPTLDSCRRILQMRQRVRIEAIVLGSLLNLLLEITQCH